MDMIHVEDITIAYRSESNKTNSLKEFFVRMMNHSLQYEDYIAIKNLSFSVKRGEVLGIIGNNGAGKSTLLKCISGILKPTLGKVEVLGNVVPMLELGSGFDMDLTGKENIYLNGAILGYSKEFLESKYDEILEFSELGDFILQPIRSYSSGMLMRLAFSIATVVEPEILIVDEILAVGDASFQQKSQDRMLELMSKGATVLFVSHSIEQIKKFCNRVLWIEKGYFQMIGETNFVCDVYQLRNVRKEESI